ncbi:MAG: hypothetical protein SOT60_10120 [Bilifractor sp.]|nr:hypothetical protein [Bilifractor sp.]
MKYAIVWKDYGQGGAAVLPVSQHKESAEGGSRRTDDCTRAKANN